jgi:pilus assembly protein CpaE
MPVGTERVSSARAASLTSDRRALIGFVADSASERALSDGLADILPGGIDLRRGGLRAAKAYLETARSPHVLVLDISGEEQPLAALAELAAVVEPDVSVLLIGEADGVDFYREVIRGLGAGEYLCKPLSAERVARHFGPSVAGHGRSVETPQGARLISITGARGGVGTTTLAVNLAGHLGVTMRRHTVLLDPDLYRGDAAFLLNVAPCAGLRAALETPDRVDALLAERVAQPAAERLHVLAGEERRALAYAPDAVASLVTALRQRYNFVIADLPFSRLPLHDDLLMLSDQRVVVMLPTLASVRTALRVLPMGSGVIKSRPVLVLNRLGCPGGLRAQQIEDALGSKLDVVIPDLPRPLGEAATMGVFATAASPAFRAGVDEVARRIDILGELVGTAQREQRRGWRLWRGRR